MIYRKAASCAFPIYRVLYFSLVKAPALVLFTVVIFFSLNGSLTGQYIDSARILVGNAPAGVVMKCEAVETVSPLSGGVPPPQYVIPESCEKVPVDEATYAASSDNRLLSWWKLIAIASLGFQGIWWASRANTSNLFNFLRRS